YILIITLGRYTPLGGLLQSMGIKFAFNWKGAVVASLIMSLPLMVRAIRISIEAVDRRLEDAARTLGAGSLRIFLTITLPLALPGIISGAILGFARSLGEFGATVTFVANIPGETQTLPLALYSYTQMPGGEMMAARLCLVSIVIAVAALAVSEIFAQRASARLKR
ncbi:MAG: ABC transporter permease subunit, partial [Spirochaetes bacterium]|nr:ABC transporter permease subunit [Spirochaetota bacterium]